MQIYEIILPGAGNWKLCADKLANDGEQFGNYDPLGRAGRRAGDSPVYHFDSVRANHIRGKYWQMTKGFNPIKPEFTIVIFIHYKPRIAVAILDL